MIDKRQKILYNLSEVNKINCNDIFSVGKLAKREPNIKAVSFNFHTPYPDTKELALTKSEKQKCCDMISYMMKKGIPVFNLRTAFPYMVNNMFKKPEYQSIVTENGKEWSAEDASTLTDYAINAVFSTYASIRSLSAEIYPLCSICCLHI